MAIRTTDTRVKELLARNYDEARGTPLLQFIVAAAALVDRVVACAAAQSPAVTHTAATLELIERWMAAHLYTDGADPLYTSRSTSGKSGSFQPHSYLNTALALDYTGCLRGIMKGGKASAAWLGKRPSEQVAYVDRD